MQCLRRSISYILLLGFTILNSSNLAFADQYADQGMKLFNAKNYGQAAAYFEQSIKNAPWETASYYYCALSYHYLKDFKKAMMRYAEVVEKFPGTPASNNSLAAINAIDPNYFKKSTPGLRPASGGTAGAGTVSTGGSAAEDKGTVEGQAQTRINFRANQSDKVVDVRINGRSTRAIFDPNGESTSFSRQQLTALAVPVPKGAGEMKAEIDLGGVVRKGFPVSISDDGSPARIGQSFLDAFNYKVDEGGKWIDLKRKSGGGSGSGSEVAFTKDGKDLVVQAEINGRGTAMIYEPSGEGLEMTTRQAKSLGLRVDEAEEKKVDPNEGPQRGDPNWVSPEDRPSGPKTMQLRLKFGPIEKAGVQCHIHETGPKYPKFSADALGSGWQIDIDYKASKIRFNKK